MEGMMIDKDKLPKGRSYPVKSSMFVPLLEGLPSDMTVSLSYVIWQDTPRRTVLEVFYWMNIPSRSLYMRAGDFPSEVKKELAEKVLEQAIPALCRWVNYLNSLPDNSTNLLGEPFFMAYVDVGSTLLHVSCKPLRDFSYTDPSGTDVGF